MYTVAQLAKKLNMAVKTLQKWDRAGILPARRTVTNRRYYTEEDLARALGLTNSLERRKTKLYCRVSTKAQKPDLENQKRALLDYCQSVQMRVDECICEVGGGMSFKRKAFLRLIDEILDGEVERVVIAHKDRFARFAFSLIQHLCARSRCEVIILNTETLSPEAELVMDLMTIIHCFSARLYGLRNYRQALKEAIKDGKGSPNTPSPDA